MNYWERRNLIEHLEKMEIFEPLMDEVFDELGKSHRLVKYGQMFEKWTLGEMDSETAISYFTKKLFAESAHDIKGRLQEYIDYIVNQKTDESGINNSKEVEPLEETANGGGKNGENGNMAKAKNHTETFIKPAIQEMIEKEQVDPEPIGGKYKPRKSMRDFISWCMSYSGYADDFTPEFFLNNFHHKCKLSTIERYFSDAKSESR
jgi:hypothetical protein